MIGRTFASDLYGLPEYDKYLKLQLRDAAKLAIEDLCPSKLYTAAGEIRGISFVCRFRMKDGAVQTNPSVNNPNIDHAIGKPNEMVKLLKIVREDEFNSLEHMDP